MQSSQGVLPGLLHILCIGSDPPPTLDHQVSLVAVTVKGKSCATGPLVSDLPHNGSKVPPIERVDLVSEEKTTTLLL